VKENIDSERERSEDHAAPLTLRAIFRSRAAYAGLVVGVILFACVMAWQGIDEVAEALRQAGWGLILITLLHLPPVWADAIGWRTLIPKGHQPAGRTMFKARWIGESINDLLPVLQMGGNVVKASLLVGRGVNVGQAGASVVVDVTLVVLSQILFTFLGLVLVVPVIGSGKPLLVVLTGSAILATLLAGFYIAQRRGFFSFIVRVSKRIFGEAEWASVSHRASTIDTEVLRLYGERKTLIASGCWHMLSWFLGIAEVWIALHLLGQPVDIRTALLFESLGQAIRTGAFAVPGALGIQEGGYLLVGSALGIDPGVALGLSLARRVRELLLGLPGLAVWQAPLLGRMLRRGLRHASSQEGIFASPANENPASGERKSHWKVDRSPMVSVINAGANLLGRRWLPKLGEESILDAARSQTRLENFGDPPLLEPLRLLLKSANTEARLNLMGRLATRHDTIRLLSNRLRMEEDRKNNPGIAQEVIRRPIIITGLPRTGTTLLHNLLTLDPAHRVPLTWETMYPSPPPEAATYSKDSRIAIVNSQILWFHRLVKGFNRIHPVGALLPEECLLIFSHSFISYQFETTHRLPSYQQWLERQDMAPAYEVHRRVLQQLQWHCPGQRWVLKAPAHMFDFEAMFRVYPDACVVMTHRDPIEVTASNASLTATLRSAFSDEVNPLEVGPECSRRWADAISRALLSRDRNCAPADHFLDLYYVDLVADPVGTVQKVYEHFDFFFPEDLGKKITQFFGRNPKDRFGKHRYSLESFGLDVDEESRRYAAYRERFRL
jgi:putative membrane protein